MASKPALKVLVLYVLGLLVGKYFDVDLRTLLILVSVPFLVGFISGSVDQDHALLKETCLAIGLISVAAVRFELSTGYLPQNHISTFTNERDAVSISGVVVRYPERRANKINLTVAVEEIFVNRVARRAQGKIRLSLSILSPAIQYGDELVVRGKLRRPRDGRNPGEFDYRAYLAAQGIFGVVSVNKSAQIQLISSGGGSWLLREVIYPVKSYLDRYIKKNLPANEAALLQGLLIGERGEIPVELRDAFSKLGVIHILAVSGLHVGFIVLIIMGLLGFLRIPYVFRVLLTLTGLVFYAYLTNLKPPVVRASVMGGLVLLGSVLQRKSDVFNTLAVAALIILISNPLELFQPGFQLSFAAVTSIVYLYPRLRRLLAVDRLFEKLGGRVFVRYPVELFLVSGAAFFGTLPFTIIYFSRLSNFSLIANLLVVPLAFCSLASGIVASVFNLLLPAIAKLYVAATWFFLHTVIEIVEWASRLPLAFWENPAFSIRHAWFYFVGLLLVSHIRQPQARRWLVIYLLVLVNVFVWQLSGPNRGSFRITFLDVGQGDAVLLTFPDGRHALIDGGPRAMNYDAGKWVIAPYLKRKGIHEIDALILSHSESDHLGGFPHLLRNFSILEVWDNGQAKETKLSHEYLSLIDSLNIRRRILRAGERIVDFQPVEIFVVHPTESFLNDEDISNNDGSLSLRFSYGAVDILMAGDVEMQGEQRISRFGTWLESEILKVSHHGSKTSSIEPFLDLIRPEWAVISVGEFNKFGQPHQEVLDRLRAIGARVLRTDRDAAVILETDGEEIKRVHWR